MVSLWLGTGRGMVQGLEWNRSGPSIRREIADWAADHNRRSSQTSYLAIRTIYRKCMFGNSTKNIIVFIITDLY